MGLEHKAYVFDWAGFDRELGLILYSALESGECDELAAFISEQRAYLTDPDEGDNLPEDWATLILTRDAHQLGDLALTKFYRPSEVDGLRYDWATLDEGATPEVAAAMLGAPFGPKANRFDPGKYGSYFQTPTQVRRSLDTLSAIDRAELERYRSILRSAMKAGKGVYVAF